MLETLSISDPWFSAYNKDEGKGYSAYRHCALVPTSSIPAFLQDESWDTSISGGHPGIFEYRDGKGGWEAKYFRFGNDKRVEPIIVYRDFHQMRPTCYELSQEFVLYHNLFHEPAKSRYLHFDEEGNESEAVRYSENSFEIRSDLLLQFCAVKQMALAIYIQSHRESEKSAESLGLHEFSEQKGGDTFAYHWAIVAHGLGPLSKFETMGTLMGKKYFVPDSSVLAATNEDEVFQEFIIDSEGKGRPIKYSCDPRRLADYFGSNPDAPHYLTPVFFRPEVLAKYYADADKYSVDDGYLRCAGLWGLRMDNDHNDYVVVFLGDLGRDLSERERNYWLSFNIPPEGRSISQTKFRRSFLAEFADPSRPDLVFKHQLNRFNKVFRDKNGWDFFIPLHRDDEHFLKSLRMLSKDNQAEFDSQLIALTKIMVDSLNEKQITKRLATLKEGDKGITKLEKFFTEHGMADFEPHVKFLRVLQDLRSKSAAHRKGNNYDELIKELQMTDEGQQKVFAKLLAAGCELISVHP